MLVFTKLRMKWLFLPGWFTVKCDFTKFNFIWLFRANFLGSESMNYFSFFILRLSILRPKSLWKSKGNMFPGRMLLIREDSIKKKYQNGSLTSVTSQKKLAQKLHILTPYRVSHSEDLRILDLGSISIGIPTVKMYHFWTNFFERSRKYESRFDTFPSDLKHSNREHIYFQFPKRFRSQYR